MLFLKESKLQKYKRSKSRFLEKEMANNHMQAKYYQTLEKWKSKL